MANGTLKILSDSQKTYCKYAYTYGGTTYSDIHTFTTGGRTSQSIAPAISTSKVSLSELNPASVSANKVIAKTNACMYEYGINQFYRISPLESLFANNYKRENNSAYVNRRKVELI